MEPTLDVGQRVLVNRFLYHFTDPAIGDIVVFHPPAGADNGTECGAPQQRGQACPTPTPDEGDTNFIKRVVAGPGDTLSIEDGIPIVNGEAVHRRLGDQTVPRDRRLQLPDPDHDPGRTTTS